MLRVAKTNSAASEAPRVDGLFEALGPAVYRRRWAVLGASLAFLLISVTMILRGGRLTSGRIHGIEAEVGQRWVKEVLGHDTDATFVALFHSPNLDPDSDEFSEAIDRAVAGLRQDSRVIEVITPSNAPSFYQEALISPTAHAAAALITLRGDEETALQNYPEVRAELQSPSLHIDCTGVIPFFHDLNETLHSDLFHAELISLPLALLVLLLVFRTAVAAALPVGVGGLAVLGGVAVVTALSRHMEIAEYTVNVCSLLGLGVAIDYSLFIVSRYREELAAGLDYERALCRAVSTAGRAVAFSGAAVATGLAGLLFFWGSYLGAMGIGGAIVIALSVVFALTFLPALLAVLGPAIHAGKLPFVRPVGASDWWERVAHWVMQRPVLVLVPTLGGLLVMGLPFLRLRVAMADVGLLTADVEVRRADLLLHQEFPILGQTRLTVVARFPQGPALTPERIGALYDLSRRIAAIPHVARVESLVDRPGEPMSKAAYQTQLLDPPPLYAAQLAQAKRLLVGDRSFLLHVLIDLPPLSDEARAVVKAIRSDERILDGQIAVTGQTAFDVDAIHFIRERAPFAMTFVVLVTLVVLLFVLGSVILPLKAVAVNLVSIAGSFGALVLIFQDGRLLVSEPHPIENSLPVLLFCVLFGLSMDYEVLMLLRMKEAFTRTRNNTEAVAEGLAKSAGLITSAAAIMVCVFSAFALARVIAIRAIGMGMAIAVALDATLIRVLIVPATMRLFGELNWWAPAAVRRVRASLGLGAD